MIDRRNPIAWTLFILLVLPQVAVGVTTKFWTVESQEQMAEGELEGMSITSRGRLVLSPDRETLLEMGDLYAWELAIGPKGDIYAATGQDGIIYRIPRKGDPEVFFDSLELEILSLEVDRKGWVYAGTSPDGMILRISPEGEGGILLDSPEDYVWDLALDENGDLYAATGDRGRIYRVSGAGKADVFYDASETHIMCLLYDRATGLYAGGEGNGVLYRIDQSGNASVLLDAEEAEISALAMDAEGNLFAAAVEAIGNNGGNNGEQGSNGKSASIYRISPDGVVCHYWSVPAEFVFDLEVADDGRLLVATGGEGQLYAVGEHAEWWRIVDLDEVQILDIHEEDGDILLATGNSGRVYRLGKGYGGEGWFTSEPFAAETVCRWGMLRWEGECPDGCDVAFSVRSGNTETPNETWSEWSSESRHPAVPKVPDSRYAQWRVRCESRGEETPVIEAVTVAYLERNLPPRLTSLMVLPSGGTFYKGVSDAAPGPVTQLFSNGIRIQYSVSGLGTPPVAAEKLGWVRSIRTARWEVSDPNDDDLVFEISYRGEGEANWKTLEESWKDPVYSWESERMPDGRYRLKVIVRDTPGNPEQSSLMDELVSDPFGIDNTPPQIRDLRAHRVEGGIEISGRASDGVSPLTKGRYSIDVGEWYPFLPEDGLFDALEESFRIRASSDETGERTILIQVVDAAGNPGVATVTVR
ncbi:MAG: hypothetical protein KAW17_08815 [Candidatus Eisenbacteria sp.]|nr:hypothetical protein [Candidatus Eisenbacteria bacterium]